MARLSGYVFEVETEDGRDEDRIQDNLWKIKGVTEIGYSPGAFGSPVTWTITFQPYEGWIGISAVLRQIDRAVKVRMKEQ